MIPHLGPCEDTILIPRRALAFRNITKKTTDILFGKVSNIYMDNFCISFSRFEAVSWSSFFQLIYVNELCFLCEWLNKPYLVFADQNQTPLIWLLVIAPNITIQKQYWRLQIKTIGEISTSQFRN